MRYEVIVTEFDRFSCDTRRVTVTADSEEQAREKISRIAQEQNACATDDSIPWWDRCPVISVEWHTFKAIEN